MKHARLILTLPLALLTSFSWTEKTGFKQQVQLGVGI